MRTLSLFTSLFAASAAHAHDGHGLAGGHWHATDALGWVALAAAVALGVWISRR